MAALGLVTMGAALLPAPLRVGRSPRIMMSIEDLGFRVRQPSHEEMLLKNFLCQRAIQTQLCVHQYMDNEFKKSWLMDFVEEMGCAHLSAGNSQLHSHTAMSVPWYEFLSAIMEAPEEIREIEVKGRRIGGGSPDNPYLPKPKPIIYTETITPKVLGKQLMTIREQLAKEWQQDLKLLSLCNAELRRHHSEEVKHETDAVENQQYVIEYAAIEGEDGEGTPLRESNFDLLKTAVTHGALLRLQQELRQEPTLEHQAEWLTVFAKQHGAAFRPGGAEYSPHAGREFILLMMEQPVSVSTSLGGNPRFLDPLSLAERLMDLREELALEWSEAMQHVPAEHIALCVEEHRAKLEGAILESILQGAVKPAFPLAQAPPPAGFVWADPGKTPKADK